MLGAMVSIFSIFLGPLRRSVQDSVFQVFFFFFDQSSAKSDCNHKIKWVSTDRFWCPAEELFISDTTLNFFFRDLHFHGSVVNPGTKLWRPPVEVTQFWCPRSGFGARFL